MDSNRTEATTMTESNPESQIRPLGGDRASSAPESVASASVAQARERGVGSVELRGLNAYYGKNHAVREIGLGFDAGKVTAIIGPSGCGKSTLVRCINRMHEEIPSARAEGEVLLDGLDLYASRIDIVAVRRAVGMVFQKPNPFPTMSVIDNVTAGLRLTGASRGELEDRGREALVSASLWDEVKDRLKGPGVGLSGGQQQRLCIARALAVEPEVLLMDEPCSALDPVATLKIEELIGELKRRVTIVIVTHNMQQAARVADTTVFMLNGELVEVGPTDKLFTNRLMSWSEARSQYQEELDRLEASALGGLDMVSAALSRTQEAIEHQDVELAQVVVADDDRIDGRYLEVHQSLITLLATQSPVATDLRLISALLHVIKCVERMGDQCVNICKMIPLTGTKPPADPEMVTMILTMGERTRTLIGQAKRAFAERDVGLARDLVRQDDVVDNLNRECFRLALEIGDDADRREWAMTMLLAARAIERTADNAVDIGEQVAFVVTGLFREFEDASHPDEAPAG